VLGGQSVQMMNTLFHEEILKKLDQILAAIKKLIKILGGKDE
jgi:hypothetical protein